MSEPEATPVRETLLRQCLAADPSPWYPKEYAETTGIDRESLYSPLNDLRLANLVQLTEWVQGKGQGYVITPLGKEVLNDPRVLAHLRDGKPLTSAAPPAPEPRAASTGSTRWERGEAARQAFYAPAVARVVYFLLAVNVLAFFVSLVVAAREGSGLTNFLGGYDVKTLQKMGALGAPELAKGEWWRLLTNCFLHFGLAHVTINMTSLVLMRRAESLWGSGRFLSLYLICGVCGSCVGIYFTPGSPARPVYLAGASGALWGVMVSQVVWVLIYRTHLPTYEVRQWLQQLAFTLALNVGVSLLPNVSAAAHFGGGVAGAIAALLLQVHQHGTPARRASAAVQLALLPILALLLLLLAMEKDHRLKPFMADVYKEQITSRLDKLAPALDALEPQAEKVHLQDSAKRDMAELKRVRDGLEGLVKQAKEANEWLRKPAPVDQAKPLKDAGLALADALIPYAEALDKQAGGEQVANVSELRKNWRDAKLAWEQAIK
ncbi:MAG TPA: rhomboid family intramembrane serine protease [Gemmataceae bacterium]|nr:rhomboid family intramembrane serine protease [Gemmataceae bacterium]